MNPIEGDSMEMLDRDIWAKTFDDIIKSQLQVIMTNTVDVSSNDYKVNMKITVFCIQQMNIATSCVQQNVCCVKKGISRRFTTCLYYPCHLVLTIARWIRKFPQNMYGKINLHIRLSCSRLIITSRCICDCTSVS